MQDENGPSFDPKTWGRSDGNDPASKPADAPRSRDDTSFDPRAWSRDPGPGDAGSGDPPPVDPAPPVAPSRAPLIAGGIAVMLAGLGIAAVMTQPAEKAAPPAATGASAPAASVQPAAAAVEPASLVRRTLVLPAPAALAAALSDAGVVPEDANAAAAAAGSVLGGRSGEVRAVISLAQDGATARLMRLEASFEDSSGVVVDRDPAGTGFKASAVAAQLASVITVVRGEMDADSFYTSAVTAGITDTLIAPFFKAFQFDFDFQREIKPGDVFEAAFEQQKNAAGQPVGQPKLLYAAMTTEAKSRALYWFQPAGEEGGWFDGNGASIVRSLMRTPVEGARISSQFGYRTHPILGYQKLHKGTDFAAPIGTPIYASGNGVIQFAAMKGPNGNFTVLRHDNGWQTLYLHQSRFMPGIEPGVRVVQGQHIGDIGTTGRSTGPHLHYEVHIDGQATDPMSIQTESGRTLTGDQRTAFIRERDRIDVARAARSGG
ncbi:peptidoglycan DD-metalloendopeptidase family protein [Sphingomonas sp. 1P06PA]|uniref:M23 family metallopeptidase n=1 Tax=Sphingomonas sp. 1P06PA TaxID=554121 RepID=UPI0039A56B4E